MTSAVELHPSHSRGAAVTVVIPTHNRSGLLTEAVGSVLTQTHTVHEIIIVDDGSNDRHRSAVESLANRSPRIRVHAMAENRGRSHARNEGLARANGDYVLFLDDDDLLDPGMIESSLLCFSTAPDSDVVVCRGQYVGAHGWPPVLFNPFLNDGTRGFPRWMCRWISGTAGDVPEIEEFPIRTLLIHCPPINACMIRASAIGATRFLEDIFAGEDWLFWLDLAINRCRFRFNPDGWVYVRRHQGNFCTGIPASADIARKRALDRMRGLGREEEFLATALLTRLYQLQHRRGWHGLACSLARYPDFLVKYGAQFLGRRACLSWLQWANRIGGSILKPAMDVSEQSLL